MNTYKLINSKAIAKHCERIGHQFNTEEIAVLIFRNKNISIDKKITLYKELIKNYPDMEVIERINAKHYASVKDMIKVEIVRLQNLFSLFKKDEPNVVYTSDIYWCSTKDNDRGYELIEKLTTSFEVAYSYVKNEINEEIEDGNLEIPKFKIIKKYLLEEKEIIAEYTVSDTEINMVNIYDNYNSYFDINMICLNIPNPFKRGDLLISYSNTPFNYATAIKDNGFPFVLQSLVTFDSENFQKLLNRGNYDSSDMQGSGYMMTEDGRLYLDNVFDYDSWEYYDEKMHGKLVGMDRFLIGVSNLIRNKISIDLFLNVYETIKNKENRLQGYTIQGKRLGGIDI